MAGMSFATDKMEVNEMELKPCPFCGSTNVKAEQIRKPLPDWEDEDGGDYLFRCYSCRSDHVFYKAKGPEKWNRRENC